MEIVYGAEVIDKNGKSVGTIDALVRNSYTGEITKFKVKTQLIDTDLFFSTEDVIEATAKRVNLKVTYEKGR